MRAVLRSNVALWEVTALAELAVWEKRPELRLLCESGRAAGRIDVETIDRVLPGLSAAGRQNILRHLAYLALVDADGALTTHGRRCAVTGEAPAWEMGAYRFLVALHPLFGTHLLDFERLPTDGKDRDVQSLVPCPDWFDTVLVKTFTSALDAEKRFTVCSLEAPAGHLPVCRTRELSPVRLTWTVDFDEARGEWRLDGSVAGRALRMAPQPAPVEEGTSFLSEWEPRWSEPEGLLRTVHDDRTATRRDAFAWTFSYSTVRTRSRGSFNEVMVEGVPVGPKDDEAARRWASALLLDEIGAHDRYVTKEAWPRAWNAVVRGTPLERGAGAPPPQPEAALWADALPTRTGWLVAAAHDLEMSR